MKVENIFIFSDFYWQKILGYDISGSPLTLFFIFDELYQTIFYSKKRFY